MIAVNQLSCGSGDSLSEGMRDAQIAIGGPTLVHKDDFQPPSPHPVDRLFNQVVSHQTQLVFSPSNRKSHKKAKLFLTKVQAGAFFRES